MELLLNRTPTHQEEKLIEFLVKRSSVVIPENWKDGLMVQPMNDGMMGSLYLFPKGKIISGRKFGKQISDFRFTDVDGIEVLVSLNVDIEGELFELDFWKTDFQKLIKYPNV